MGRDTRRRRAWLWAWVDAAVFGLDGDDADDAPVEQTADAPATREGDSARTDGASARTDGRTDRPVRD